ncbi:MAG: glycosyltransferase family 2 protein [bacterium]|nr:glycosyltransferase family 2 protein [bacterium]
MAPEKVGIVIVNYKDYANKFLPECLTGLRKQSWDGITQLFIVDNKTSAESFVFIKKHAPAAEVIRNLNNDGFAKGNNDGIKQAMINGCDYIFLLNMDTVADKDCVKNLVSAIKSNKKIGAVQARLMLADKPNVVNSLGNVTHFLGFGFSKGYREKFKDNNQLIPPWRDKNHRLTDIAYPSGAAVLLKKEVLEHIGLFDEEFWMYNEDQDLGWRIWLSGYKCVLAPNAVVYHKYEFSRSVKKYYWLDRNRIVAMIKNYHWLTLILIMPAFVIMEFGLVLFSLKSGWFREKARVWFYFCKPRVWLYLYNSRKQSQKIRKVQDRVIVKMFSGRIWYQEVDDIKLRLINPIFNWYWFIVKKIIIW